MGIIKNLFKKPIEEYLNDWLKESADVSYPKRTFRPRFPIGTFMWAVSQMKEEKKVRRKGKKKSSTKYIIKGGVAYPVG